MHDEVAVVRARHVLAVVNTCHDAAMVPALQAVWPVAWATPGGGGAAAAAPLRLLLRGRNIAGKESRLLARQHGACRADVWEGPRCSWELLVLLRPPPSHATEPAVFGGLPFPPLTPCQQLPTGSTHSTSPHLPPMPHPPARRRLHAGCGGGERGSAERQQGAVGPGACPRSRGGLPGAGGGEGGLPQRRAAPAGPPLCRRRGGGAPAGAGRPW